MHRDKHGRWHFNEFTVLEAFLAFALFGLLAGALFTLMFAAVTRPAKTEALMPPPVAMTEEEYRAAATEAMAPFVNVVASVSPADIAAGDAGLLGIIDEAQNRLLTIERIPKEDQQAHLSFVLLLDKWRRALNGSAPDAKDVMKKTDQVLDEQPWVRSLPDGTPAGMMPPAE